MKESVKILSAEVDGHDGIVVTFSDGTTGAYVVEQLLHLRPRREALTPTAAAPATATNGQKHRATERP